MQAAILLTLVIIIGLLFKKEKSQYSRVVIGSVFGIMFFSIWPLTVFYIEIHDLSKNYNVLSYAFVSAAAIILSYLLIRIKQELFIAIFAFLLFFVITIYSMSYESNIKNKISIYTDYFDKGSTISTNINTAVNIKQRKLVSTHNYIVSLNNSWQKKTDKGQLFKYFILSDGKNYLADLRPKCFSTETISLPEIIKNTKHVVHASNMKAKSYCYKTNDFNFACKVLSIGKDEQTKRVRWYSFNTGSTHGIELDFVIFKDENSVIKEIEQIINSAKFSDTSNKTSNCLGLTEWM